jgi:hypothetical protein
VRGAGVPLWKCETLVCATFSCSCSHRRAGLAVLRVLILQLLSDALLRTLHTMKRK